jgi:hypothetical protein
MSNIQNGLSKSSIMAGVKKLRQHAGGAEAELEMTLLL